MIGAIVGALKLALALVRAACAVTAWIARTLERVLGWLSR